MRSAICMSALLGWVAAEVNANVGDVATVDMAVGPMAGLADDATIREVGHMMGPLDEATTRELGKKKGGGYGFPPSPLLDVPWGGYGAMSYDQEVTHTTTMAPAPPPRPAEPTRVATETAVTTTPTWHCPRGFTEADGRCRRDDAAGHKWGCPEGWQWDGGACIGALVKPPSLLCDQEGGWTLAGEVCVRPEEAPRHGHCPEGFSYVDGSCVRERLANAEPLCPDGTPPVDGHCAHRVTQPARIDCRPGFELRGEQCERVARAPAHTRCTDGALRGDHCVVRLEADPLLWCRQGALVGDRCTQAERAPHSLTCTHGELAGDWCVSIEQIPSDQTCPPGLELKCGGGHKAAGYHHDVAAGTYPHSVGPNYNHNVPHSDPSVCYCENTELIPKIPACGAKHLFFDEASGMCLSAKKKADHGKKGGAVAKPEWVCPAGYHKVSMTECARGVRTAPQRVCPPEWMLEDGLCLRKRRERPARACPLGFRETAHGCERATDGPAALKCEPGARLEHGRCVHESFHPPEIICPPEMNLTPLGGCERIEAFPADLTCPLGFELASAYTEMGHHDTIVEHEVIVEAPPVIESAPIMVPVAPALVATPASNLFGRARYGKKRGMRRLLGVPATMTCVKTLYEPPEWVCPTGFELREGVAAHYEEVLVAPDNLFGRALRRLAGRSLICARLERAPAAFVCADGFVPNEQGGCERTITAPPLLTCLPGPAPEPAALAHKPRILSEVIVPAAMGDALEVLKDAMRAGVAQEHAVSAEAIGPENLALTPISDVNDLDMTPIAASNLHTSVIDENMSWVLLDGQCVARLRRRPARMCPVGFTWTGMRCEMRVWAEREPLCPADMEFDALTGRCFRLEMSWALPNERAPQPQPEEEALLPLQETPQPQQAAPMPQTVQVIRQPVPIPAPVVYLPRQLPRPLARPPPIVKNVVTEKTIVKKVPYPVAMPVAAPPKKEPKVPKQKMPKQKMGGWGKK